MGDHLRPVLVDLFCKAGGMTKGYQRAGFYVVGVDIEPQPNYCGDEFIQADAIRWLHDHLEEAWPGKIAALHASPPCQHYLNLGAVNRALGRTYEHPDLIATTRGLLALTGKPYVIENGPDARKAMVDPVRICGTGLDLPLRRHRLFESNVPLKGVACAHHRYTEPRYWTGWRPKGEHRLSTVVQVYGNAGGRSEWSRPRRTEQAMTDHPPPFVDQGQERGEGLDLSDPAVRRMVEQNHTPDEVWTVGGQLLSVHCYICSNPWPCPSVVALRALPKSEGRDE